MYVANASTLLVSTFTASYIIVLCNHTIGPKLAILAALKTEVRQFAALSQAFLLAPVRLHVGNFELSSEYANGLTLWFVGLLLATVGLVAPGGE